MVGGVARISGMYDLFAETPALARLRWLLDGLDGRWSARADVESALAPDFTARVAPGVFLDVTRGRADRFAPIRVVGVDAVRHAAPPRPHGRRGRTAHLLTTLAYRELRVGRSAILDTTAEDPTDRARWASLAAAAGAAFVPVVCVCTDDALHRERLERRTRSIPGWADAGDWANASARLVAFPPWSGALLMDTVRPLDECVAVVLDRVGCARSAS